MRRPVHQDPAPGRRVALITLCVPSHETIDVIADQLRALTQVRYPHDSWILDEGADPEIEALAAELGVRYFTRKGLPLWNQPGPPFQAKTKAGNVNAWLDYVRDGGPATTTSSSSSTSTTTPRPSTSSARSATSTTPTSPGSRRPASAPTSTAGPRAAWPSRTSSSRARCRWASTATAARRSSSARIRATGPRRSARSAATSRRARRTTSTPWCSPPRGFTGVYVPEIIAEGDGPSDFGTYLASSSPGRTRWCRSSSGTRRASCGATRPRRRSSSSWRRAGTRSGRCRSRSCGSCPWSRCSPATASPTSR